MSYGFLNVGGVLSTDYNIFVLGVDDANIPVRDYSVYSIPGRNRDLHYDNGRFENIDRTYHLYARAIGSVSAKDAVMAFCAELMQLKGISESAIVSIRIISNSESSVEVLSHSFLRGKTASVLT